MKTRWLLLLVSGFALTLATPAQSPPPLVSNVEWQPLTAQIRRVLEAMSYQGSPLSEADRTALEKILSETNNAADRVQAVLDRSCLFFVNINGEMRVKVSQGPARPELMEQGWRQFLVKVQNEAGTTAPLRAASANSQRLFNSPAEDVPNRWLDLQMFDAQPLKPALSGLELEYRIIQLYSRDAGRREAKFSFNVGQGTQDIGFRNETDVLFTSQPSREITLGVRDDGGPTTASFVIRDRQGRVYPSQAKRLAPDFAFHPQIYRADGEKIKLPDGEYIFEVARGPESISKTETVHIEAKTKRLDFKIERWIDPSKFGWWSGDHHIHAAGCAHYTKPTEGVFASDMMRHVLGEDLKVGCNLTWGPCFDFQKQFFTGKDDKVSQYPYLLHYDVEVSQFGSHQSGHLCLLRLKEEIYPGGDSKDHWPTLCLNTLRWAKKQGAVCGPAHSGWGLESGPTGRAALSSQTSGQAVLLSDKLPNYIVPPFNGIGANEYVVDVTHEVEGPDGKLVPAVDFMSAVDTPYVWELNMWYHTLNCGFRTRISGETDFPCIYGERVGLGRSYVKQANKLSYDDWCQGIREGRNYVGDGKSHLIDFKVNDVRMGENGSELKLAAAGKIRATARVAARLNETPDTQIKNRPYNQKPYWDVERARVGDSREVTVELVVDGYPVAQKNIVADGKLQDISFDTEIAHSSWVAMRILPSSHTNPIFVLVGGKSIRASRRSAEWCLKGVDQCWSQKQRFIKANEMDDAKAAYAHARDVYKKILGECEVD